MRRPARRRKAEGGARRPQAVLTEAMRRPTLDYLRTESGSGLVLAAAAVAALGFANSRLGGDYFHWLALPAPVRVGDLTETLTLAGWVRALLMPVFFLVLGMELKFETLRGELSNPRRLALPALAAAGGLAAPAAVYLALNQGPNGDLNGWPIGCATDGAAALAALAIAGPRLPHALRVLVMSVALADNLITVTLAALFDDRALDIDMLIGAGAALAVLAALSRWRRAPFFFYAVGFVAVWGFTLKSGLDPALAGVASALTVPIGMRRPGQPSALKYFMDSLHPYVAYAVLPIFVFTAAGFSHRAVRLADLAAPGPLGVMLALALGKPLGVFGLPFLAATARLVRRPIGTPWTQIVGAALICGVGFTTSYFMAGMWGPPTPAMQLAILLGSVIATLAGVAVLARSAPATDVEP
jgi:NhaA family Na+:H+ antiporter